MTNWSLHSAPNMDIFLVTGTICVAMRTRGVGHERIIADNIGKYFLHMQALALMSVCH